MQANTCEVLPDAYGWAYAAEAYATNVLKINLTPYKHRILVLPNGSPCQWAGLGNLGCGDSCYVWVQGTSSTPALTACPMPPEIVHAQGCVVWRDSRAWGGQAWSGMWWLSCHSWVHSKPAPLHAVHDFYLVNRLHLMFAQLWSVVAGNCYCRCFSLLPKEPGQSFLFLLPGVFPAGKT
jgi:hypothetical protein